MRRLALLALCAGAATAAAQDRPTVLQLPAGARALGVGNAFVAGRTPEVLFYNPAQLALNPGVSASVQRFSDWSATGSLAGAMTLPVGAVGMGLQYLEFTEGALGVRTPAPFALRGPQTASSMAASLAYTLPTIKTVRSGVTAKFVGEQIGNRRDGGAAFDVGLARDFFGRTTLAFAAQNLGTPMQIDGVEAKLPTRYVLAGYAFAPPFWTWFDATAFASLGYTHAGTPVPSGGVELSYVPLDGWAFTGRVGARKSDKRSQASALTLGAGVGFDRVAIDWALQGADADGVDAMHRIGLRVR